MAPVGGFDFESWSVISDCLTWQEVATQGSRVLGAQVLFQAQVETTRSYLPPASPPWKFP